MKKAGLFVLFAAVMVPQTAACQQGKSDEREIAEAVSALPVPLRDGAEVRAFRGGELVMVRKGTNEMICLGDNPAEENWHVACYHKDLEPFMAKGRELRASGVIERPEIDAGRLAAIESGEITFPEHPTSLYSLFGSDDAFDPETGEAPTAGGLYVIYTPNATEESSGISAEGSRERPWLMFPGTPWSHVMIPRPPKEMPASSEESS